LPAKKPALRPTTWFRYRKMTELYICPKLESVPLTSLATRHLEALYTHLLHHGRLDGTGGLAPKTVLNVHQILRKALGDAVRMQLVSRNVALTVDRPARDICPEQRCWTAAEHQRFLAAASGHRFYPAMWLAATTGMRRGELLGLRWHDIDLDAGHLSIRRSVSCTGYEVHVTSAKTRPSRRSIDLDDSTIGVLDTWRRQQALEDPEPSAGDDLPVFTTPAGAALHPHAFSQAFGRLVKNAKVPRIRLHDLRHTHAMLLLKAGVPLKVVSERLGHSTPAFTMVVYQHVLPGMQRDAANTFAALLSPGPTLEVTVGER
jgi:hypothetical protein